MSEPRQSKKLVVLISHNGNDDKSSVGFTIANAALTGGFEVGVFLTSDGVELARHGASDMTEARPLKKLAELIDGFVERGGVLWCCSPCFQHRGLKAEETVDRTTVTGAGPMLEWIGQGAATICL